MTYVPPPSFFRRDRFHVGIQDEDDEDDEDEDEKNNDGGHGGDENYPPEDSEDPSW